MYTLSEAQVRRLLDPSKTVAALEETFRRDYHATVCMPARLRCDIPSRGVLLTMPCYDSAIPALGVKLVSFIQNQLEGSERLQATYVLLDPDTGKPQALLAANYLTHIRTAATSAVATKFLGRTDARTLGIFGTGSQARAHIAVLRTIQQFERILVCGSRPERSKEFSQQLAAEQGVQVQPVDARTCVTESEVLCTCTTSTEPLFDGNWLRPGTHLNLVGTFHPDTREVDDITIKRARVVLDTLEGGLSEAGDLLIPLKRGIVGREHIVADLHEIVSGKKVGRRGPQEITLFKSVGCALEDLVAATLVYEEALRQGLWTGSQQEAKR